jgi:flagellar basal-body rod protein FlgC
VPRRWLFLTLLLLPHLTGCPGPGIETTPVSPAAPAAPATPAAEEIRELIVLDPLDWSAKYLEAGGLAVKRVDGSVRLTLSDRATSVAVISGACLALRRRMTLIAGNVSNAETTRLPTTPAGAPAQPYRRKVLAVTAGGALEVVEDKSDFRTAYRPGHPDADKDGNVLLPNVYLAVEMHEWRSSQREYEVLRLALTALSPVHFAPPAELLTPPVPPPPYEPRKAPAETPAPPK